MGLLCLGGCPPGLHLPVLLGSVPKDHLLLSPPPGITSQLIETLPSCVHQDVDEGGFIPGPGKGHPLTVVFLRMRNKWVTEALGLLDRNPCVQTDSSGQQSHQHARPSQPVVQPVHRDLTAISLLRTPAFL